MACRKPSSSTRKARSATSRSVPSPRKPCSRPSCRWRGSCKNEILACPAAGAAMCPGRPRQRSPTPGGRSGHRETHGRHFGGTALPRLPERIAGGFVRYRPPVNAVTWLLWFGPFVLLVGAVVVLVRMVRANQRGPAPQALDEAQRAKAQSLLHDPDNLS